MASPLPLAGRNAVITGVSRRQGKSFAVASRLARMGASLFVSHYRPHDEEQLLGADSISDAVAGAQAQLTMSKAGLAGITPSVAASQQ